MVVRSFCAGGVYQAVCADRPDVHPMLLHTLDVIWIIADSTEIGLHRICKKAVLLWRAAVNRLAALLTIATHTC